MATKLGGSWSKTGGPVSPGPGPKTAADYNNNYCYYFYHKSAQVFL